MCDITMSQVPYYPIILLLELNIKVIVVAYWCMCACGGQYTVDREMSVIIVCTLQPPWPELILQQVDNTAVCVCSWYLTFIIILHNFSAGYWLLTAREEEGHKKQIFHTEHSCNWNVATFATSYYLQADWRQTGCRLAENIKSYNSLGHGTTNRNQDIINEENQFNPNLPCINWPDILLLIWYLTDTTAWTEWNLVILKPIINHNLIHSKIKKQN